jgi:F420-non-reducing hydrogenase iron-sulfur subunit
MVLHAFEKGAEGVMVLGCRERECRYGPGPKHTEKMQEPIRKLMHILGLESKRFLTARYAFNESERLLEDMNAFTEAVSKLKKSPLGGL